jgi:general secretion pathway protein H
LVGARAQRGFSLLELLVVVAIVGIMVGVVVIEGGRFIRNDREIDQEAQRLRSLVDLLHEEALLQSHDFGVRFTRSGYRFYTYDYKTLKWVPRTDDRLLNDHELANRLGVVLALDGREVELDRDFDTKGVKDPEPQVFILSSGELTPFEVSIYRDRDERHVSLKGEQDGTLTVAEHGF